MRTNKVLNARSPSSTIWLNRQSTDPYIKKRTTSPQVYRSRSAYKLLEIDARYGLFLQPDAIRAVVDLGAAPGGWSQVVAHKLGWSKQWERENEVVKVKGYSYGERGAKLNKKYGTWSSPKLEAALKEKGVRQTGKGKEAGEPDLEEPFDPLNIDNEESTKLFEGRGTIVSVDLLPMIPIHGVLDIQADFLKPETENLINRLLCVKGNMGGKADIILSDMAANLTGNHVRDTESSLEVCESVFDFATRHLRTAENTGRSRGGVLL